MRRQHDKILRHYGILGMRWGVRRDRTSSSDSASISSLRKKKAYELSNEELKKVSQRIRLEQEYSSLNKSTRRKGAEALGKLLKDAGTEVTKEVLKSKLKNLSMEDVMKSRAGKIGQSVLDQAMHLYLQNR